LKQNSSREGSNCPASQIPHWRITTALTAGRQQMLASLFC